MTHRTIGSDSYVACYGKKKYISYWAARRAAKQLNKFRDKAKSNPYHCTQCHFWHVGNTMGKFKKYQPSRKEMKRRARDGRI